MLIYIIFIWGLGIGDWGLGPIPNPQSPIPLKILKRKNLLINKNNKNILLYITNYY